MESHKVVGTGLSLSQVKQLTLALNAANRNNRKESSAFWEMLSQPTASRRTMNLNLLPLKSKIMRG